MTLIDMIAVCLILVTLLLVGIAPILAMQHTEYNDAQQDLD